MPVHPKGYVAILTVLTLMVLSLSLTTAVTYLSIGEAQQALAISEGEAALQAAEGCAQDALLQSFRDETYAGGQYTYLEAECDVAVSTDGTEWTLTVSSTKNRFTRSLEIVITREPGPPVTLTIESWLERS